MTDLDRTAWPLVAAILLLLTACGEKDLSQPAAADGDRFVDIGAEAGLNQIGPSWGLAVGDFDGDGWLDLFSSNHGSPPQLFRGQGAMFEDASGAIAKMARGDLHGAAWADFDNDGDQDLLALTGAKRGTGVGANRLLINEDGRFTEQAEPWGLADPEGRGRAPTWIDWNSDGKLDVLLNNAADEEAPSSLLVQGSGRFDAVGAESWPVLGSVHAGLIRSSEKPSLLLLGGNRSARLVEAGTPPRVTTVDLPRVTDWAAQDFDGDGQVDLIGARGGRGATLVRRGVDAFSAHLPIRSGSSGISFSTEGSVEVRLAPHGSRWWQTGHVAIGTSARHPRRMKFSLTAENAAGMPPEQSANEKSIRIGYRSDVGRWEIRVATDRFEVLNLFVSSERPVDEVEALDFEPNSALGEIRYLAGPDFTERSEAAQLASISDCGAVLAGDFDNDRDQDLFLLCTRGGSNLPNLLLDNDGSGVFTPVADAGVAGSNLGTGDTVVTLDYDRDGFLDLVVANGAGLPPFNHGPLQLFRNRGNGHRWLQAELHGALSGVDGIGAEITLVSDRDRQTRLRGAEMHAGGQSQPTVHFGLGSATAKELQIRWPNGFEQRLVDPPTERILHLFESSRPSRSVE